MLMAKIRRVELSLVLQFPDMEVMEYTTQGCYCENKIVYDIDTDISMFNLTMLPLPSFLELTRNVPRRDRLFTYEDKDNLCFDYAYNNQAVIVAKPADGSDKPFSAEHVNVKILEYKDEVLRIHVINTNICTSVSHKSDTKGSIVSVERIVSEKPDTLKKEEERMMNALFSSLSE